MPAQVGAKMSKTLGNVVDPNALLDKGIAADSFRYFCCKDASPGADVKFSEAARRPRGEATARSSAAVDRRPLPIGISTSRPAACRDPP